MHLLSSSTGVWLNEDACLDGLPSKLGMEGLLPVSMVKSFWFTHHERQPWNGSTNLSAHTRYHASITSRKLVA